MGHGDETNYIYLLKASEVPSVLAHLASSLDGCDPLYAPSNLKN